MSQAVIPAIQETGAGNKHSRLAWTTCARTTCLKEKGQGMRLGSRLEHTPSVSKILGLVPIVDKRTIYMDTVAGLFSSTQQSKCLVVCP